MAKRIRKIPPSLIFICEEFRFVIVDSSVISDYLEGLVEPWLQLPVGEGKVFEERPIKVVERRRGTVFVATKSYTAKLDLLNNTAARINWDGSVHDYRGSLQSDDGRTGWVLNQADKGPN